MTKYNTLSLTLVQGINELETKILEKNKEVLEFSQILDNDKEENQIFSSFQNEGSIQDLK
jgi:hypothetical protein